ncbi:hypothetical protein PPL_02377 [Heterostelium album PN500]|uniref:Uncharacterized protein n=1 Tax=Heterostelium pallidum (strain ATCC 26659 / Pp 5 / PN500) TaxID=670386 RepID=D3AZJ5_HETP5|nr:hypothetical protein PPL_02377 [Heterostelium album PN500]EFA85374.1 hypothetical protein PPL_02377 [Heterostelium album PN500]|eukprot:XP_020437483.1 hypothetical protein PPL_02377 [Heterostelium album PN500]
MNSLYLHYYQDNEEEEAEIDYVGLHYLFQVNERQNHQVVPDAHNAMEQND